MTVVRDSKDSSIAEGVFVWIVILKIMLAKARLINDSSERQ